MSIRPLHDRIIVRRVEEGEQQIGGIIVPDTAKEKPQQGTVIAVGNGKVDDDGKPIPLDVRAGDRILFGKYAGQEIKLDGDEYLIMKEDDVLAVMDEGLLERPTVAKGKAKPKAESSSQSQGMRKGETKSQGKSQGQSKSKSKSQGQGKSQSKAPVKARNKGPVQGKSKNQAKRKGKGNGKGKGKGKR